MLPTIARLNPTLADSVARETIHAPHIAGIAIAWPIPSPPVESPVGAMTIAATPAATVSLA